VKAVELGFATNKNNVGLIGLHNITLATNENLNERGFIMKSVVANDNIDNIQQMDAFSDMKWQWHHHYCH
jgi:hypothetical protein